MLNVFAVNSSSAAFNIFSSPPSIPPPGTTKLHNSRHLPIPIPTPPPLPRKKKKTEEKNENGAISERQQQRRKGKGKQVFKHNGVFTTKLGEERGVTIGEDGTSYRVAGAPFEFRFSYSETPRVRPLALREKPYVPFGPPTVNRPWTGRAPLPKSKKMLPELDSFHPPKPGTKGVKYVQPPGPFFMGKGPLYGASSRDAVLGEPLTREEINELVEKSIRCSRQVNLGRDGLTHNMLELIHTHWKRRRVCRIKCKGVPTVDMDNVCHHLEEKTGGSIIHRVGGVVYLFRGRNYNYKDRPKFPLMLWKPATPVYPKLIVRAPEGLTVEEADALRRKGRHLPSICKLGKNGVYFNLVKNVREAFEESELVRINCQGMKPSDYKRIGAKLKEMVPCVLLSFDKEHILMWRGKENKSKESATKPSTCGTECLSDDSSDSRIGGIQSTDKIICPKLGESAASWNMQSVKQSGFSSSIDAALESKIMASQFKQSREDELNMLPVSVQSTETIFDRRRDCQPHKENDVASKYETGIKIKDSSGILHISETEGWLNPVDMSEYRCGSSSTDDITVAVDSSQTSSESLPFPTTGVQVFDAKFVETVKNDSLDLLSKLDCQKHEDIQGGNGVLEDKDTKEKEHLTTKEAKGCRKTAKHIERLWHQAIESRIALLLDDPCLDPDLILEKSNNFAQTAPPGQYVRSKQILSARKGGKHEKPDIGNGESNQSEGKKMSQEISPFLDTVPLGMLPVDDLSRLLLAP